MPKKTSTSVIEARVLSTPHVDDSRIQEAMVRYQALFDSNMIGVAGTDFSNTIFSANDAFLSIIGYTKEDIDNKVLTWDAITPLKYTGTDDEKVHELLRHKSIVPFEKEYVHKDGHLVPVLVGGELIDEDLPFGVCFALNITDLKKLEQKKDDFIGMVSHELKTPLSVMKIQAGLLENAIREEAPKQELLDSASEIGEQIDKLNVLINDLLNMARYRNSDRTYPLAAFDLCEMKNVVRNLALIANRNIRLLEEGPLYVRGNKERLAQVVTNLINNALSYSSKDSDVIVRIFQEEGKAHLLVQDFGMGIEEENLEKIFQRYYRVNHADDYLNKGTGIGLYICNEIIKHHGGSLRVQSTFGEGSIFTIVLPLIDEA